MLDISSLGQGYVNDSQMQVGPSFVWPAEHKSQNDLDVERWTGKHFEAL